MAQTEYFVGTSSNGGAITAGRPITVLNVSRTSPVPWWVTAHAVAVDGPGQNPFIVDAVGAAEEERASHYVPPPVLPLERADVRELFGWDDGQINEAMGTLSFPKPSVTAFQNSPGGLTTQIVQQWRRADVDRWQEIVNRLFPPAAKRAR